MSKYSKTQIIMIAEEIKRRNEGQHIAFRLRVWRVTVMASYLIKRVFDIGAAGSAIFLLSPFFLTIAILIKLSSPGPVIFCQTRVGQYGRHFNFYKFRSMRPDAPELRKLLEAENESGDGVIFKMKNDPRITKIGKFLRRTSLDETPQLFNVLLGDMSLVGPRPPLPAEVQLYTLEDRKRLNIRPGITCIWQVSGRSDIPFNEQVMLDKEYIASKNMWVDLLILLKTIPAVLSGRGAY